jgi:HAD superfamily hydrolase (TIGR01450 family)
MTAAADMKPSRRTGRDYDSNIALAGIRHVALDMDGTIYSGGALFSDTLPFLDLLNEHEIGYTFLTNNSSKGVSDYISHLEALGISAAGDEIFTSTLASIEYLWQEMPAVRRLFVLGTESMRNEIAAAGFVVTTDNAADEPEAVLVGFDTELTFTRLCRAAHWIKRGKPFIASHPDRVCPTDEPTVLVDCGSVCAALKEATGRSPDVVLGKPDQRMLRGLLQNHDLQPENLMMVGDRLYTDMEMARRAGAFGALVLTGETTLEDVRKADAPPDLIVSNLAELGAKLVAAKRRMVVA